MTGVPLRVLLIEDSDDDAQMIVRELRRGGYAPTWERVDTRAGLEAALAQSWDVILCDYSMPGFGVMQAYEVARARGEDRPFILVSGTIGEEAAVEAMRAGVDDFVLKDRLARLAPAIARSLAEATTRRELRRAEAELQRSDKLRALGEMAAGIAHDFKNLLNPLGLHVEILDRTMRKAGVERPEAVEVIRDVIRRSVEIIDRLRSFTRLDPEPVADLIDLAALTREAIAMVQPRLADMPALAVVDETNDTGLVPGHGNDVLAAVLNVLGNALDACGGSGRVTLRSGGDERGVWVQISDDGPGMTPEIQARVFEPFFSTKGAQGTGLGLANVFATVRRHGGEVSLETAPGRGATFTLRFPRAPT